MPLHHASRIEWTNLDRFKLPKVSGKTWTLHFVVAERQIRRVPHRRQWRATYYARILSAR